MGKINVLDKHVAELIAAGEVVERPASVIKELVENSIDAGAAIVTVEIKAGGVSYMRITDNGCGMAREDVPVAFLRHATSKVHKQDDLEQIGTLGFRGEALASVASVSHVEVLTCEPGAVEGTHYIISGGEEEYCGPAGCAAGTTMMIRDLFYNTPARMKFLKKDVTEANAVAAVMDKLALSHPEVSIRFIREGKEALHCFWQRIYGGVNSGGLQLPGNPGSWLCQQTGRRPPKPQHAAFFYQWALHKKPHRNGCIGGGVQGNADGGKIAGLCASFRHCRRRGGCQCSSGEAGGSLCQ